MQLLKLPVEIFQLILRDAIFTRGLKRSLRLRLVNKVFAKAVLSTLYTFDMLEDLLEPFFDRSRPELSKEVPISLRGPYLAHRVMKEPPDGNPILVHIRHAAIEIHKSGDLEAIRLPTVDDYVKLLCSSMDSYYAPTETERRYEQSRDYRYSPTARFVEVFREARPGDETAFHFDNYLYAASIRTNCLSLIRHCISKNPRLRDITVGWKWGTTWGTNLILGDCFVIAAHHASKTVLEYLLTADTRTLDKKFRQFIFVEAAHAGRAEIVSWLFHFMSDEVPWEFMDSSSYGRRATMWVHGTSDLDTIKFALTLSPEPDPIQKEFVLVYALQEAAAAGRLDTVKYLIQHDVPATGSIVLAERYGWNPVCQTNWGIWSRNHPLPHHPVRIAAKQGHISIIDFLLQHGASASVAMSSAARHGQRHAVETLLKDYPASKDALLNSVMGGYTSIARMLLDQDVDAKGVFEQRVETMEGFDTEEKRPLVYAIGMENVALFDLLIEHGADLDLETAEECVKLAKDNGLESMLELLGRFGIQSSG